MPVKPEKAIHLSSLRSLKYFIKGRYQRIYWGVEFCQNLIPGEEATLKVLSICRRNNVAFSFVTPFVTEPGLDKIRWMLKLLSSEAKGCEIIVNDWGILELLNTEFFGVFSLSLGRLLVRQHRDPLASNAIKKHPLIFTRSRDGRLLIVAHKILPRIYKDWVKASYFNSTLSAKFLLGVGIKRVELSNLIQGVNLRSSRFLKSLYTPFVNISTTRFCPMDSRRQRLYRINTCNRECRFYYEILQTTKDAIRILKRGNTLFYENQLKEEKVKLSGADRIVYQPELPF